MRKSSRQLKLTANSMPFLPNSDQIVNPINGSDCAKYLDVKDAKERIAFTHEVASWCLRSAQRQIEKGNLEAGLSWNQRASRVLVRTCGPLVSQTIERNLLQIASTLPKFEWKPSPNRARRRWLHVLEHALTYGGLTAMARRWIDENPGNDLHSVAFTSIPPRGIPEA